MPIENAVAEALNAQMGRELEAHLQYLSVSSWFDAEGLPELHRFFAAQAAEEHAHAMKFLTYIQDAGGRVAIPGLAAPKADFESAEDAVQASLDWEVSVTGHINDLVNLAIGHKDHATQAFLQWFVTEQVEEVATMTELLQVTRRAGEANLLLLEDYVARSAATPGSDGGQPRRAHGAPLRGDDYGAPARWWRGGSATRWGWSCTASSSTSSARGGSGWRIARRPAGFLPGLVSAAEPDLAYVQCTSWTRLAGHGGRERLYREFCARAHARGAHGCAPSPRPSAASRRFHERLGLRGGAPATDPAPTGSSSKGALPLEE